MFKSGYLKVLTPVTTNGRDPVMTTEGKIKYRESHMHPLAQKRMIAKNAKLPNHLKHIIELVKEEPEPLKQEPVMTVKPETKKAKPVEND